MAIPQVERSVVEKALAEFDAHLRDTDEWADWEDDVHYKWAIVSNGRRYPPKQIIRMATGTTDFAGGPESNDYLTNLGFPIEPIKEAAQGLSTHGAGIVRAPKVWVAKTI